jgi:hypothetical protein
VSAKKPVYFDRLMGELRSEFDKGAIVEANLRSLKPSEVVHGVQMGGVVIVDPTPHVVEVLLHELLHRRFPRWGERRVEVTANRLMLAMPAATRRAWYRRYRKAATKCRDVVPVPAEARE